MTPPPASVAPGQRRGADPWRREVVELVQHVRHRPVDDAEALVAAVAFGLAILGAAGKCGGSGGLVLLAVLHLLAPRGRG